MDPEIAEHLVKNPGSLRLNAGLKPPPRIQRPSTKAQQLAAQRKRLERHELEKWERVQHERRSQGFDPVPFPGLDALEALRKGVVVDPEEVVETPAAAREDTTAEAFEKIGEQSKEK